MECESSVLSSVSSSEHYFKYCRPIIQRFWINNKGATLILIWSFLCFSVFHFLGISGSGSRDAITEKTKLTTAELLAMGLLLPIGGWLADAYFGRYRVIRFGMWTMWFGAMLNGISLVISIVDKPYSRYVYSWVSLTCKVIMGAGIGAFQANIIQFGIDQLIDASSTEIKSFIMWYAMTPFASGITIAFSVWCTPTYVLVLVVALFLTLGIVSNFLLNHWLVKEQIISNPLPQILKVVHFSIKSKFRKWKKIHGNIEQQGLLSKFNVAKRVYNGPFTSEQVEDVKTFFRVILVIAIFIVSCSGLPTVNDTGFKLMTHFQNWPRGETVIACYKRTTIYYYNFTCAIVTVLVYQIFINPLFHKCIPRISITTKLCLSVIFFFAGVMALLGIESFSYIHQAGLNQTTVKCIFQSNLTADIDFYWLAIPLSLNGICSVLFIISGIEFICAQAPVNMKGLILGIGCALYGLNSLIQVKISIPFISSKIWERAPLTCGIWYFMLQGFIVLVSFLVAAVIVKTYKRRTRLNMSSQSDWQEGDSYTE